MIVHGGAGSGRYPRGDKRFKALLASLDDGLSAMRRGSSLDGVEAAVRSLESSGLFNAGRGACLTSSGKVELDAAVMDGRDRSGAGVAVVDWTYHPVSLARWVSKNTKHVLVAGSETRGLAEASGLKVDRVAPSAEAMSKFKELSVRLRTKIAKRESVGTVGAVAIDSDGIPSSAVSTGGIWMKLPGRIGDSAILGAGVYSDWGSGAACATGTGEEIIRSSLCWNACSLLKEWEAPVAAKKAIDLITDRSGTGTAGIITVDLKGRVGWAYNTEAMGRAWLEQEKGRPIVQV